MCCSPSQWAAQCSPLSPALNSSSWLVISQINFPVCHLVCAAPPLLLLCSPSHAKWWHTLSGPRLNSLVFTPHSAWWHLTNEAEIIQKLNVTWNQEILTLVMDKNPGYKCKCLFLSPRFFRGKVAMSAMCCALCCGVLCAGLDRRINICPSLDQIYVSQ